MPSTLPKVGYELLDGQHAELLVGLSDLEQAVYARAVPAALEGLRRFWDHVVDHFATEESLMEVHAYPELAAHRSSHQLFLGDLRALIAAVEKQGLTEDNVAWAAQRAPAWFAFHTETNDVPLGRFLARREGPELLARARRALGRSPKRSDA